MVDNVIIGKLVGFSVNKPIFEEDDILKTNDIIARLIRKIFVIKGITHNDVYTNLYQLEMKLGTSPKKIVENYNNLKSALIKPKITSNRMYHIFYLMGWTVDQIDFVISEYSLTNENLQTMKIELKLT